MKKGIVVILSLVSQGLLAQSALQQVETKADSAYQENNVVQEVDSLRQDGRKVMDKVSSTVDSINYHTDVEGRVDDRIDKVEQDVKGKLKENKAVQKVEGMDAVIDNQLDVSEKINLDTDQTLDMPGDQLNSSLSSPNEQLGKVKSAPQNAINEVKGIEEVQAATDQLNQANGVQQQVSSYSQDAKALSEGDLDKVEQIPSTIEQKAQGLDEVQELQKQAGQGEQIKQMPNRYKKQVEQYQNQEYLKQQARAKLAEKAIDHFAGRDETLQQAMQQLSKYKRKYLKYNPQTGEKQKINTLKGKPLKERLVFGSTMQIHQGPPTAFDVGLTLAYRFDRRWSGGIGSSYRLIFEDSKKIINWDQNVYGGRIFTDYKAIKSFFVHGEFETLNTLVPAHTLADDASRQWVPGALAGIGKTYQVKKKIKGNVIFMYNFLHGERSPYDKPWVIRFGFALD